MNERRTLEHAGRRYVWTGQTFYGESDFTAPPAALLHRLRDMLAELIAPAEDTLTDWSELLDRAKHARGWQQYQRAERLARRALELNPTSAPIASVLCSVLRESTRPADCLQIADAFRESGYTPLLTSRAAALCDLGRWDEALWQIEQVRLKDKGQATQAVLSRIRSQAPHLFAKKTKKREK